MATIFYARVSTAEQNISHQRIQAELAGFSFDRIIADEGFSGVTTKLNERPEGKRLFDILRKGDILVVRWLDRLGRDYSDVCETIRTFMQNGIIVQTVVNRMTFDGSTKDPIQQAVRDALIGFLAAMSQAQTEVTKEAQKAGIAHAKANGAYKGRRPSFNNAKIEQILTLNAEGKGVSKIAKNLSLTRQTVYRILANPAVAISIASSWEA
jgi:putative DNA-invertase from lambdoid prophage Rac